MRTLFSRTALSTVVLIFSAAGCFSHAKTATEVFELASASTVVVKKANPQDQQRNSGSGSGSGIVIGDGHVVTNCHVIKNAKTLTVHSAGKDYSASLLYADWPRDLCALNVAGLEAPAAVLGNSKTLKVGAKVYALGAPKGLALTLSDGIVSGFRERKAGRYIQTTAAISRGSSGGGLFDENGALIGLTTFYMADAQNLNFAIPIEWVSELPQRSRLDLALDAVVPPESEWQIKSKELKANNDWTALLQHTDDWTRAEADNDDAWKSRGMALYRTGQTSQSIDAWSKAIRVNPDDANVWFLIGAAHTRAGSTAQAINAYQHALSLDPKEAAGWYSLGKHYEQSGQRNKVRDVYKKLKHLDPVRAEQFFSKVMLP
jgi:predicted TPR repeat methyltransferase